MKKLDSLLKNKIPTGFEMLYDNSSAELLVILNNAIQYGVLTPLGLADAAEAGKSIYFLLEGNLGPGLGVLIACWFFGKGEEHLRDPENVYETPVSSKKWERNRKGSTGNAAYTIIPGG